MNCVRCKSPMNTRKYENVEIDQCPQCKGIWLDEGEIARIIDVHEEKFGVEVVKRAVEHSFTGIPKSEEDSVELCPKCGKRMDAINYGYNSGVIIDRCPAGHGLWFDSEELDQIQASQENWQSEMTAHKDTWVKHVKEIEAASNAEVAILKQRAGHVPSRFLFNRIAGVLMKIIDND